MITIGSLVDLLSWHDVAPKAGLVLDIRDGYALVRWGKGLEAEWVGLEDLAPSDGGNE